MENLAKIGYLAALVLAIPLWFWTLWNYIKMVGHARNGNIMAVMFNMTWWHPETAKLILMPSGLVYYRRTVWGLIAFLVAVIGSFFLSMAMALFPG